MSQNANSPVGTEVEIETEIIFYPFYDFLFSFIYLYSITLYAICQVYFGNSLVTNPSR